MRSLRSLRFLRFLKCLKCLNNLKLFELECWEIQVQRIWKKWEDLKEKKGFERIWNYLKGSQINYIFEIIWKISDNAWGESSMIQMHQMFQGFWKISENEWEESSMLQMFLGFWKISENQMGGKRWCSKCNVPIIFKIRFEMFWMVIRNEDMGVEWSERGRDVPDVCFTLNSL